MSPLEKASPVEGLRAAASAHTAPVTAPVSLADDKVTKPMKPVRVTVDFDRETRRYLKRFTVDMDAGLMRGYSGACG